MLNRLAPQRGAPAKIEYHESDFSVLLPGSHVICAVTGAVIPLDELKYWSFKRQEPYADAAASLDAERQAGNLS